MITFHSSHMMLLARAMERLKLVLVKQEGTGCEGSHLFVFYPVASHLHHRLTADCSHGSACSKPGPVGTCFAKGKSTSQPVRMLHDEQCDGCYALHTSRISLALGMPTCHEVCAGAPVHYTVPGRTIRANSRPGDKHVLAGKVKPGQSQHHQSSGQKLFWPHCCCIAKSALMNSVKEALASLH